MPALIAANGVGALLFGVLYLVAGLRAVPSAAFLPCLLLLFVLITALWVRMEARTAGGRDALGRLGRGALALAAVVIGLPVVVLMPVFWLDDVLPPEAGLRALRGPIMTLVLIVVVLVLLSNLVGTSVVLLRALGRRRRPDPSGA